MGRLLVLVMAAALLLAGSATTGQAAGYEVETSVVLRASDSTVTRGETVTLSGRVVGARLGTQILLQRRVGGTWQTVKTRRLRDTRRYSFLARPPRGVQRFRVMKPRQLGQLRSVSRVVAIGVQWVPGLTATAESRNDGTGRQILSVAGAVTDGAAAPVVKLERRDGTTWTVLAEQTLGSPRSAYAFEEFVPPGGEFRVRLAGTALTLERTSATFRHAHTPYVAEMNTDLVYLIRAGTGQEIIEFDVNAGELVTLAPTAEEWVLGAYSPSGELVAGRPEYPHRLMRFKAAETGTYRLKVWRDRDDFHFRLAVSLPKVVEGTMDGPAVTVSSELRGQPIDVRFDATGTRAFTVSESASSGETVTLVDGRGDVVEPWLPAGELRGREPVYRPGDGVFSLRVAPMSGNVDQTLVRPLSVQWVQGEVNGPFAKAVIDVPDRVVLVEYDAADEAVQAGWAAGPYESIDFGVYDTATGAKNPTGPGGRVAAVAGQDELTTTVDVQLTTPLHVDADVDGDPVQIDLTDNLRRVVSIHFTGRAGQPIYEERASTAGSLHRLRLTTADGTVVTDLRSAATRGLWILPKDGEYILEVRADGYEQRVTKGTARLLLAPTVELPGDGTPVTVAIDKPNQLIVGVVPMPAGTVFEATLDNLSEGLSPDPETRNWEVELKAPADGSWYDGWRKPGTLILYTVREPGDIVAIISAEVSGSLRLRFDPRE